MGKVILVLCDALRYDVAVAGMGYLGHLVEVKLATLYKVRTELPSLSRPMYETVQTGVPMSVHGVGTNQIVRRSVMPNVFEQAVKAGKTTAAAAYSWVSELYNRAPYDPIEDRETDDLSLNIQHGRFYTQDEYPDIELIRAAAMLVRRHNPDYLLLHPMGMDYHGHVHGSDSPEYRNHAIFQDQMLANIIPEWLEKDYSILVTGDHGMNKDRMHGGDTPEVREVPLYMVRPGVAGKGNTGETISQLQIAPTVCKLLGVPIPETMRQPPLV